MKKIVGICLAVMMMVFAFSIVIAEDSTDEYGIWNIDEFVDEFDMPAGVYYIDSDPLYGKFSNSATTNSDVTAILFCEKFSDTQKPFIKFKMYEYDSYLVKNAYSSAKIYDIIMMDGAGVKHNLTGIMLSHNSALGIADDEEIATVINALKEGGTVRFAIVDSENSLNKYSFAIDEADGFDKAYSDWLAK